MAVPPVCPDAVPFYSFRPPVATAAYSPGASPFPATRRGRLRSRAPGSQGAAFRNAGALGEARTRRSRGARRLGGVEAAFASSRSRSHPRPGSASLFSPHFGTGLRRSRAFSQGRARRGARPAPPAPGRPRRPDAAPDTPPRTVPGRPLVAFAPRLSRLRTGLAEGAPGIGAAAAAPVAVARLSRTPPRYRRRGPNPAQVHGAKPQPAEAWVAVRSRPGAATRTGRRSRSGRGRAGSIRGAEAMRDAARRRCGPGKGADRTGRRRTARSGPRGARRARRSGAHAAKPQPAEASRTVRCETKARGKATEGSFDPWPEVANAGGTARRGCPRGWDREREKAKAGVSPPSRRAPRDRRAGAPARGPAFAIPATVARAGRRTSRARHRKKWGMSARETD